MHIHFLDPYRPRFSLIHRLDPRVKFVLALALILTTALTPMGAWPVYILLFSIVLSVELLSELGVRFVLAYAAGEGGGHVQSLILAAILIVTAVIVYAAGLIADLIAANRILLEEIRMRQLRNEANEGLRVTA